MGGISTGTVKGGIQGAFTAVLFNWAGTTGTGINEAEKAASATRYAAHAAAGCVSAVASGANCGSGAASAVFGKYTSNQIGGWDPQGINADLARGAAATVAGGFGSVIAGGKFDNGAQTAAFGYLFNYCSHGNCTSAFEQAMYDYWPGYKAGTLLY
ncbi:MAG: hypothetical protein EON54_28525, partial [Alcaligenaceae bacterium]